MSQDSTFRPTMLLMCGRMAAFAGTFFIPVVLARVFDPAGFGTYKQLQLVFMIFKGRNRDTAWYSILDDEWPEVRKILERWLAPGNFDQDGTAKTSLAALMEERGPSRRT